MDSIHITRPVTRDVFEQYLLPGDLLEITVGFSQINLKSGSLTSGFVKNAPGVGELGLVKRLNPGHLNQKKQQIYEPRTCPTDAQIKIKCD